MPSKLLQMQTQLDLDIYLPGKDVEVLTASKLKYDGDGSFCYLCDEIDAILVKQALIIAKEDSVQDY